ncbi:RND transporter [Sulfurimicrobium lacus]|uniref:RND transporter n=1 Tax=Sulfurimicrobium lacus TaxID=2715678 RepID=A0A6F8V8W3_9PROT|nr:efflux RND transporter periplasmic adaptor subunit [Sulfurimicrobium lacus]BCB25571.1 RND transporter [Sulfurimicrobium lacus]
MNLRSLLWNKFTLVVLLVALAAGGYLYWKKVHQPSLDERYKTQALEMGDVTQTVSANGTLNPVVLVNVGTQVSGTVKKLYVDFNGQVEKGQVLMELDPAVYQAQVDLSAASVNNARASLDLAQANEARARELFRKEYISRQELDQAVQALKSARAQVAQAQAQAQKDRTNLGYTQIHSPVSGVVVSRMVDVGQTVAASFQTPTLFTIAQDLSKMQIDSSFAEADIGNIKVGQQVRFTVDAFSNRTFHGTVKQRRLNPTTQQNVVTYDVVVAVDNPELILMPGMTAYVNIVVAQRKEVLLVPNAALRFRPADGSEKKNGKPKPKEGRKKSGGGTVYVLENGQLKPLSIVTGITDNKFTEVVSGDIKAGQQVVTEETVANENSGQASGGVRMRMF